MEEEGTPIIAEEVNSDIGGIKTEALAKLKKQIIIGVSIGLFLIFLIIIIIFLSNRNGDNSTTDEPETPKEKYGEIECTYEVSSTSSPVNILGEEFKNSFTLSIYVGDTQIKYSKNYKFPDLRNNIIRFVIHEKEVSLDNMFKNVLQLQKVRLSSDKNVKIKSMESLFENCGSLTSIEFDGFDTSELKSMKKTFYNCYSLTNTEFLETINTKQVTDMSYLFANADLESFSPKSFDTSSVTTMSHMFDNCFSLREITFPDIDVSN